MSDDPSELDPTQSISTETSAPAPTDRQEIGPYRLLQKLGEGGMGEVWLAEQTEPVRRRVALKIIKRGMDTERVVLRFEAERQALALMNHPNVAKVFDAGATSDGRPYFAMEHVHGVPITEHCDRQRLNTRERLEIFRQVCAGLQHAHQKGIIHRDIKPSNVLVQVQDAERMPKIIDFGVAKATQQRLTERTVYTELGQLIGTPEYMSPEQAEMTAEDIDTRTDVYSLGVLLYELLVGVLPFDSQELRQAGFDEIRRKIREEEPSRPSTRLGTLGEASIESAKRRRTDVSSLLRQLAGDLDWITMKALEKDRTRRYGSPSDLAADIERHLNDEPVLASSPGTGYRLGKFVRRHRVGVAASGLVALALLLGMGATLFGLIRARRAETRALVERNRAESQSYLANLRAAEASSRLYETAEVKRRLADCKPELRGWEWWYLKARTDSSLATLSGHESVITTVALYPDGSRIASASIDGTVRIWDTASRRCLEVLSHEPAVPYTAMALSPDGSRIATGDFAKRVQLWDASSGEQLGAMSAPATVVTVAFSHDGKRIAAGTWDPSLAVWTGSLIVWDVQTRQPVPAFERPEASAYGTVFLDTEFTPNSEGLVTIQYDNEVTDKPPGILRLWDATTGRIRYSIVLPEVTGLDASPDGSRIVAGVADTIQIRDLASGRLQATLTGHGRQVLAVAFSADGTLIASGACDNTVRIWNAQTGAPIAVLVGHDDCVQSVVFDRTGSRLFSGSADGSVRLWDSKPAQDQIPHVPPLLAVAFSPDGKRIATGGQDGIVRVFDADSRELVSASSGPPQKTWSVAFDSDGSRIASGHIDGTVRVWSAADGESITAFSGHEYMVGQVAFSPDGALIASRVSDMALAGGDEQGVVRIQDSVTGADVAALEGLPFAFAPDGSRIVTANRQDLVVWGMASAERVDTISKAGGGTFLVFSPDGRRILTARQYELLLLDLSTREFAISLIGHDAFVRTAAFSPDGKRIVSGGMDETLRIWDAMSGDLLLTLRVDSGVADVEFSPDGKRVAAACWDGMARIWETPAEYRPGVAAASDSYSGTRAARRSASGAFERPVSLVYL